jgi:hypothetical protein
MLFTPSYAADKAPNMMYQELGQARDGNIAQNSTNIVRPLPVYLSELSNLNDYSLFANGGWDGNWYVGFNVCWMEEIPAPPSGNYVRAFIGAKLGRMKTRPRAGKPVWEKEPIPGSIYISINSTPSWKQANSSFLVDSRDIPLEGDMENALENVGESRWFWAEIPVTAVNSTGPNFLALWSPTEYFVSTASSPILAGGWGSSDIHSWLNNDVKGYPPFKPETALKTGISAFKPAIAIKLVPAGTAQDITVKIQNVYDGRAKTQNKTFAVSVTGEEIEKTWLEVTNSSGTWTKVGKYVYEPPFLLTLNPDLLQEGKMKTRACASDIWGNTGSSEPAEIEVSRQKK